MTNPTPADITPETLAAIRGDDTPESVAARIDPHALTPAHGAAMIRAGLGREAATLIRAQAAEIARLTAGQDAGREIMRQTWECLNSFRAQYGRPQCLSEEPFDAFLQSLADVLGDDCKPWMTDAAKCLIGPYTITIGREQDATIAAEERATKAEAALAAMTAERDAADAYSKRLSDALSTRDKDIDAAIFSAIRDHRLWYTGGDGGLGYPLVDALTPGVGGSIDKGVEEIRRLADEVADVVTHFNKGLTMERDAALAQAAAMREALLNPPPHACTAVTKEFADEAKRHELAGAWIMGHRAFAEAVLAALEASAQAEGEGASNFTVIPHDPPAQGREGGERG